MSDLFSLTGSRGLYKIKESVIQEAIFSLKSFFNPKHL